MSAVIHLHVDHADGALQRLIGLVERRGFHIDAMSLSDEGAMRGVQLQVRGRDEGRCTENLGRQIDKLIGATRVGFAASAYGYQSVAAA